jgi:Ca-activated chloride channel family protein
MKRIPPFTAVGLFLLTALFISAAYQPAAYYALTGTSTLNGVITDAATGEALPFVQVHIKGTKISDMSDVDGRFTINNMAAGKYTLVSELVGYADMETVFSMAEGDTLALTISMQQEVQTLDEVVITKDKDLFRKMESRTESVANGMPTISGDGAYYGYVEDAEEVVHNTEEYDEIQELGFRKVVGNPLSTFSIDVDNASYSNIRRFISYNQVPQKDVVRIEEMINYFDYEYPQPTGEHPFEVFTEISETPWNADTRLVMIGIQGKDIDYSKADPSNLVFLMDVSGSMSDGNKLPLVKKSMYKLIDQLSEKDRIAIVVYAGAAGLVLPSTPASDKATIKKALDNLQAGGSTAGGAGIELAYKTAAENLIKGGNNRVILCTDGDFNVGTSSDAEMVRLIEEKRKSGVFLTICGFGMGNYKDSKMEKIANNGNGNYFYIDSEKEAEKVFVTDMRGTLFTIAKDVKIQVEFNPAKVAEYRLIGYENRMLNTEDFEDDKKDAGELGAGHRVTAIYEVKLADDKGFSPQGTHNGESLKYQSTKVNESAYYSEDIMSLSLRYKKPGEDVSRLIERSVVDRKVPLAQTSDNYRWAAAVAEFGLLLRDSEFKGDAQYEEVLKLAKGAQGKDVHGYRAEFIGMVEQFISFASVK